MDHTAKAVGTHNGNAPSFDYIAESFLPAIKRIGYRVGAVLDRYGFYPAGGGVWRATVFPVNELNELELLKAGELLSRKAVATSARIPDHVTERELTQVKRKCYWSESELEQNLVSSAGPGNMLSLRLQQESVTDLFEIAGERGVSAERVAGKAIRDMRRYLEAGVPVGVHLADQLLLPMVLGKGGRFRTLSPSDHLLTNIYVIQWMTDVEISITEISEKVFEVSIKK